MDLQFIALCINLTILFMGISYIVFAINWIEVSIPTEEEKVLPYFHEMLFASAILFAYPQAIFGKNMLICLLCLIWIVAGLISSRHMDRKYPVSERETTSIGDWAMIIYCISALIYVISVCIFIYYRYLA